MKEVFWTILFSLVISVNANTQDSGMSLIPEENSSWAMT